MTTLAAALQELDTRKEAASDAGRRHTAAKEDANEQELTCLELMEGQECDSFRTAGVLFTRIPDRVKGQVEDRAKYIRWALENDEGVQEFLGELSATITSLRGVESIFDDLQADFYALLVGGLELVAVKEKQDRCNAQAKAHIDNETPLPPGLTFRPDPYVQMRRS